LVFFLPKMRVSYPGPGIILYFRQITYRPGYAPFQTSIGV
jgi:hypothetical protein